MNCCADDLAGPEFNGSPNEGLSLEGPSLEDKGHNIVALAKRQFSALKRRGTVWLRTQKAMDKLLAIEDSGNKVVAQKLAMDILQDSRLIANQIALERARYLLATLESGGAEQASLDAIRTMVTAADGEAALALAAKAFQARSISGH